MISVFISYRREDSRHQADRLYDHLAKQFGKGRVFKDVDSIPLGLDFREILTERVAGCDVFLAVIGDEWLSIAGQSGTRRLDDPGDYVRIEVEGALSRKIPVIPVLVGNASVPNAEELPESLRELSFRQQLLVRPDPDFHNDMNRLICGIRNVVSATRLGSASSDVAPTRRRPWNKWLIAVTGSLFGLIALGVIIITIRDKNRRKTKISVPDDSTVVVESTFKNVEIKSSVNGRKEAVGPIGPHSVSREAGSPSVDKSQRPPSDNVGASAFVPLFNGKDLWGWRLLGNTKHTWRVLHSGVLEGSGPPTASFLTTDFADFSDFHLRVETKLSEGSNSQIGFRITESNGEAAKYSAYIAGTNPDENNTGCLRFSMPGIGMTLAKADPVVPIELGEWFTEEVIADREVITVIVKGIEVAKFKILHHKLVSGAIDLTCRGNSRVVFRKIEIKKLNGAGLGALPVSGVESDKVQGPFD
jgi:hypothetical protein